MEIQIKRLKLHKIIYTNILRELLPGAIHTHTHVYDYNVYHFYMECILSSFETLKITILHI